MHGIEWRRPPSTPSPSSIVSRGFHTETSAAGKSVEQLELESVASYTPDVKFVSSSGSFPVCHGMVAIAGRRRQMENAILAVPAFLTIHLNDVYDFFGVYNGHGGPEAAEFCKKKLYQAVTEEIKACVQNSAGIPAQISSSQWRTVMTRSFSRVWSEMNDCLDCFKRPPAGAAAVVVVNLSQIVIANTGDSRSILYRNGTVIPLENATKKEIECDVNECTFSEPAVECFQRSEEDEFLILASRGLWDVVETAVACQITSMCLNRVNHHPSTESSSDFAAAFLVKLAFSRGSSSNISVVVIDFKLKM